MHLQDLLEGVTKIRQRDDDPGSHERPEQCTCRACMKASSPPDSMTDALRASAFPEGSSHSMGDLPSTLCNTA